MLTIRPPEPGRPYALIQPAGNAHIMDVPVNDVIPLYKQFGALLFRGFGLELPAFGQFARQYCKTSVLNESPGRQALDPACNVQTVDGGTRAFSLHPELSREPWKPDAAFFACLSPPSRGGETTICDGVALVREMPAEVRQGLEGRRLLHIRDIWPGLLDYWLGTSNPPETLLANPPPSCPYRFGRLNGTLVRYFTRPALHRPMFIDAPAFGNFLLFARFNNNRPDFPVLDDGRPVPEAWLQAIRAAGQRITTPIGWQRGDVLMLDNTRFMHGRAEILDIRERLIASFFGYLNFAPPNPEEPPAPPWRKADFSPPLPPL